MIITPDDNPSEIASLQQSIFPAQSNALINAYLKLFISRLFRVWPVILITAAVVTAAVGVFLHSRVATSPERYIAHSNLFYAPHQIREVRNLDIAHVITLFERKSMRASVEKLLMNDPSASAGANDGLLTFTANKQRTGVITISATALIEQDAISLVNAAAQSCIAEYTSYRQQELSTWIADYTRQHEILQEQINQYDESLLVISSNLSLKNPAQERQRLNDLVSSQMAQLASMNVKLADLTSKVDFIKESLKDFDDSSLRFVSQLKYYESRRAALLENLDRLRSLFTDENPKVITAQSDYEDFMDSYNRFKHEHNITIFDPGLNDHFDAVDKARVESLSELNSYRVSYEALQRELETNQAALARINEVIPEYSRITEQRDQTISDQRVVSEQLNRLNLLYRSAPLEVQQLEPCKSAAENLAFAHIRLVMAAILGLFIGGAAGSFIVLKHIFFGKISSLGELDGFPGLQVVGQYPAVVRKGDPEEQSASSLAQNKIFYAMNEIAGEDVHSLFMGVLPGGVELPELWASLKINHGMNGRKMLEVEIMPSTSFSTDKCPNNSIGKELSLLQFDGTHAVMPVDSLMSLSPAELKLLQHDCAILRRHFDLLVFWQSGTLSPNELFLSQMIHSTEASLLFAGENRTPRAVLRDLSALQRKNALPLMVILCIFGSMKRS